MKKMFLLLIMSVFLFAQELQRVSYASPQEFSGLWYEIARTYNSYQEKCVASSVEYRLVEPLKYEVFNRCFDSVVGGELIEYSGSARPAEGESVSSIDMTYFWIFTKSYHIYYLDKEYAYAVVADEDLKQVWIMSRKPTMPKERLSEILALLSNAMDIKKLIYTPQDEKGRYK